MSYESRRNAWFAHRLTPPRFPRHKFPAGRRLRTPDAPGGQPDPSPAMEAAKAKTPAPPLTAEHIVEQLRGLLPMIAEGTDGR
ncbi:MAG: hypothetical protein ACRDTA_08915 [Pseudonocardiaceae bacterium]